jgi:hypothetical protein
MGDEAEQAKRLSDFQGYQVTEQLCEKANPVICFVSLSFFVFFLFFLVLGLEVFALFTSQKIRSFRRCVLQQESKRRLGRGRKQIVDLGS